MLDPETRAWIKSASLDELGRELNDLVQNLSSMEDPEESDEFGIAEEAKLIHEEIMFRTADCGSV